MSGVDVLPNLDPVGYACHWLHAPDQTWGEKNCYVDLWIELLHSLRLDPLAMLGFTLGVDFLGDQWTFFKPQPNFLQSLYGIDVQELNVWQPLIAHARHHLGEGRLIATEADAFWLPDTSGTDYRRIHSKTTILLAGLDMERERLTYFHNAGYFLLEGADFRHLFGLERHVGTSPLPMYAELITIEHLKARTPHALSALAWEALRDQALRRPSLNPVLAFGHWLERDWPTLRDRGMDHFHLWAFANLRQLGGAFDLGSQHLRWLVSCGAPQAAIGAVPHFEVVAQTCKALVLKLARSVKAKGQLDVQPALNAMANAWHSGWSALDLALRHP